MFSKVGYCSQNYKLFYCKLQLKSGSFGYFLFITTTLELKIMFVECWTRLVAGLMDQISWLWCKAFIWTFTLAPSIPTRPSSVRKQVIRWHKYKIFKIAFCEVKIKCVKFTLPTYSTALNWNGIFIWQAN